MTARDYTDWTCDGCDHSERLDQRRQPIGWCGVDIFPKPLHAERDVRVHLCQACTKRLGGLLDREVRTL